MANMNLKVPILATGVPQPISASLPNSVAPATYVQQLILQNQGLNNMYVGDSSTTNSNGLLLGPSGSANAGSFMNYGTYLSDWWVVGTAGDVLFCLYIK